MAVKNWGEKSAQAIFNHVAKHLVKQNAQALSTNPAFCVCYDKNTNRRCAVGCLLPLKYYHKMGDIGVDSVFVLTGIVGDDKFKLLDELQFCHDTVKPSRWKQRLRAIARANKLEIPEFLHD